MLEEGPPLRIHRQVSHLLLLYKGQIIFKDDIPTTPPKVTHELYYKSDSVF